MPSIWITPLTSVAATSSANAAIFSGSELMPASPTAPPPDELAMSRGDALLSVESDAVLPKTLEHHVEMQATLCLSDAEHEGVVNHVHRTLETLQELAHLSLEIFLTGTDVEKKMAKAVPLERGCKRGELLTILGNLEILEAACQFKFENTRSWCGRPTTCSRGEKMYRSHSATLLCLVKSTQIR